MLTDFQKKKLTHRFYVFDIDKNGHIDREDFVVLPKRLAERRKWSETSAEFKHLAERCLGIWEGLSKLAGSDKITLEQFITFYDAILASPEKFESMLKGATDTIFDTIDLDGNGTISVDEYEYFLESSRMTGDANALFKKLNRSGTGFITKAEIIELMREFYYSEDRDAAGNWLFGEM